MPDIEPPSKEVIFEEKPSGAKLDTSKEDKNLDLFRQTKEKFKKTRKMDALEGNPFKMVNHNQ